MIRQTPRSTLVPSTTLFRSHAAIGIVEDIGDLAGVIRARPPIQNRRTPTENVVIDRGSVLRGLALAERVGIEAHPLGRRSCGPESEGGRLGILFAVRPDDVLALGAPLLSGAALSSGARRSE